jgi:S1-C subfamily serine protease
MKFLVLSLLLFCGSGRSEDCAVMHAYDTYDGASVCSGTGFVIDDRVILTARHVTDGGERYVTRTTTDRELKDFGHPKIFVQFGEEDPIPVMFTVNSEVYHDLSLLVVKDSLPKKKDVISTNTVQVGGNVRAVGYPSRERKETSGTVERKQGNQRWYLTQTNIPILPGYSGGPVYDNKNQVVGVMVNDQGTSTSYYVPSRYVTEFIQDVDKW